MASLLQTCLGLDEVLRRFITSYHSPPIDWIMLALSAIGQGGRIWLIVAAVVALVRPSRVPGVWQTALAIGFAALVVDHVAKPLVGRVRPFDAIEDVRVIDRRPDSGSLPSGHAATAFAGALAVGRMWPAGRVFLWGLAVLIAFSRVYVGVHYPLDVLAGGLLGLLCAAFVVGRSVWYDRGSARSAPTVPR